MNESTKPLPEVLERRSVFIKDTNLTAEQLHLPNDKKVRLLDPTSKVRAVDQRRSNVGDDHIVQTPLNTHVIGCNELDGQGRRLGSCGELSGQG